jgi:peptidyl-prolyl cis-trans isomerase SurA
MRMLMGWMLCVAVSVACATDEETPKRLRLDGVAAYVNGSAITVGEVLAYVQPLRQKLMASYQGEELGRRLREAYQEGLDALVDRRLILEKYDKNERKLPDWVVDNRIADIVQEAFKGDRDLLLRQLGEEGLSFDEWRKSIQEQIAVVTMRREFVEQFVRIRPADVRAEYEKNKERFRSAAKVKVRLIAVRKGQTAEEATRKQKMADDIRRRALAGEDFAALAVATSEDSKAKDGGDWGWIEPEKVLRQELAKAVVLLKLGEISPAIETDGEFYIAKVDGVQEPALAGFEVVQAQVERDVRQRESEKLYRAWVARLRGDAVVKVVNAGIVE